MQKTIVLNGQTVYYELIRKRVKNLNLRIRRDGTVVVSCSSRVPEATIERFMQEKAKFILDGITKMNERTKRSVRPVEYQNGEIVSVAGYYKVIRVLSLEQAHAPKPMVIDPKVSDKYSGQELFLIVKDPDNLKERANTYEKWKRKLLRDKVLATCQAVYPHFKSLGVEYPKEIKFSVMKSKWGCCRPLKGSLSFSYNLFEVPDEAMHYVVVHEFAHFLEANHSARFYAQVAKLMPDWKRRRDLLNEFN